MDFTFSPEQEELRRVTRAFLAAEVPPPVLRELMETDGGVTDDLWSRAVDLGWTSLVGDGSGLLEAVILCEELGAIPMTGPFLSSCVAAPLLAARLGDDATLAGLVAGRVRGTVAIEEGGQRDPLDSVATVAERDGAGWVLTGHKPVVLDGRAADLAYVIARDEDGLAAFALDAPGGAVVPSLDVTRTVASLHLDRRPARRVGPAGDQRSLLSRVVDDIAIALCAESVGACDRALHMASEYAKGRVQFDRPIATFQAIRHKIVDMLHQLELARVATHYAAWTSAVDDPKRAAATAIAKSTVAEAAVMITGENIQVHGGVGFTWDIDAHLLFRRVKANDVLCGRQGWQRQRLADLVIADAVARA